MKFLLIPLVFLAGVCIPLEAAINSKLREAVQSPLLGTLLSFLIGLLVVCLALPFTARGSLAHAGAAPWWVWVGGILGVFIVLMSLIAVPKIGAAVLIVVTVFGQLLMSLAMDNGGWLGVPKVPLNGWRIAGAILVLGGVLLTTKK